jgi:hypothetical protein
VGQLSTLMKQPLASIGYVSPSLPSLLNHQGVGLLG